MILLKRCNGALQSQSLCKIVLIMQRWETTANSPRTTTIELTKPNDASILNKLLFRSNSSSCLRYKAKQFTSQRNRQYNRFRVNRFISTYSCAALTSLWCLCCAYRLYLDWSLNLGWDTNFQRISSNFIAKLDTKSWVNELLFRVISCS